MNRTSFEPGSFILPLYGSAGLLAYLCGLALARVAVAWLMGFNTSPPVFVTVVAVVLACLVLTIGIARYAAINKAVDRPEEID